jgi:hypothetical protein
MDDNIEMVHRVMGCDCVHWTHLVQDRKPVAGSYENGKEQSGSVEEEIFFNT